MDGNRNTKPEPTDAIPKGQASPARRPSSTDTERPPSAQQFQHDVKGDPEEGEEEDIGDDPAEKIVDFDWDKLSERYHEAMTQCQNDETALMQEWESLMNFFKIWAESGHDHESDRTFSRLKTRVTHVQHSEEGLERKREHYIRVVEAFQSALQLLQGSMG